MPNRSGNPLDRSDVRNLVIDKNKLNLVLADPREIDFSNFANMMMPEAWGDAEVIFIPSMDPSNTSVLHFDSIKACREWLDSLEAEGA